MAEDWPPCRAQGANVVQTSVYTAFEMQPQATYTATVGTDPKPRPKGPWTPEEIARNERVAKARVMHDRKRGISANLEDGVVLTRFANRFAEAFRHAKGA